MFYGGNLEVGVGKKWFVRLIGFLEGRDFSRVWVRIVRVKEWIRVYFSGNRKCNKIIREGESVIVYKNRWYVKIIWIGKVKNLGEFWKGILKIRKWVSTRFIGFWKYFCLGKILLLYLYIW